MLANVVDLEEHAMLAAARCDHAMIVLVDFKAAFPSVSHAYLKTCLRGIGVPPDALWVIDALYDRGRCSISSGETLWPGFHLRSGIRQGCPLCPLIFATAMDLFLRMLRHRLGRASWCVHLPTMWALSSRMCIVNFLSSLRLCRSSVRSPVWRSIL